MWFDQDMRSTQRHTAEAPESVLGRAVAILAAFDEEAVTLGVSELSRRTGIAKSTVHRLAGELEARRLLAREGSAYRLGDWLFELGRLVPTTRTLSETAQPIMEDLREATHMRVHLAALDGVDVVYLNILGGASMRLASRIGGRLPAHATGVGKVMLAYSSKEVVAARISAGLPRLTARTVTSGDALLGELRSIRAVGMALEAGESHEGVACLAAPVFGVDRRIVAGLSLTGPVDEIDPIALGPAVRTAAFVLSRTLRAAGG